MSQPIGYKHERSFCPVCKKIMGKYWVGRHLIAMHGWRYKKGEPYPPTPTNSQEK